jgi:HlyD family secretion protein
MNLKGGRPQVVIGIAAVIFASVLQGCRNQNNPQVISASGTVEAVEVNVASKTAGQVEKLLVQEGARVAKGDVLAIIDSSSLEIQLREAEAAVALAEAQLELLLKGARIEDIRQAEGILSQAQANLKLAEDEFQRIDALFAKQSATAQQRDNAETRLAVARAQHEVAKQGLQRLERFARPEELKQARARLEQAAAGRDLLKKMVADATIVSPTPGIVTHKAVEQGEYVSPGTTLVTVADLSLVRLEIFVPEPEVGRIRLGQSADVTIDSYPGRAFRGEVIFISPEAEFTPKNIQTKEERVKLVYRVKIGVPNSEVILKPGMPADAIISLAAAQK